MKQTDNIKIESLSYPVCLGFNLWHEIDQFIQPFLKSGGIYLLADHNTSRHCLPILKDKMPVLAGKPVLSLPPGERSKDPSGLERIWNWLMESGACKDSLLINLGGGMVSDLGGFAAATFNRGMPYINIPTSLIAQADAAIGGKTGLNISGIKNQAGLFYDPAAVFIMPAFLDTLQEAHLKSGFAEIIKCAALSGPRFWKLVKKVGAAQQKNIFRLIYETVSFKCRVIKEDPTDKGIRKMLNFGHTIGHALESISIVPGGEMLLHGQAVAAGMICESYLSNKLAGLGVEEMNDISSVIRSHFDLKPITKNQYDRLAEIVKYDKKKGGSGIGFSLLEGLGKHSPGIFVSDSYLIGSFEFYNDIIQKR